MMSHSDRISPTTPITTTTPTGTQPTTTTSSAAGPYDRDGPLKNRDGIPIRIMMDSTRKSFFKSKMELMAAAAPPGQQGNWGSHEATIGTTAWGQPGQAQGNGNGGAMWPTNDEKPSPGAASWAATAGHGADKGQVRGGGADLVSTEQDEVKKLAVNSVGWGTGSVNQDTSWETSLPAKENAVQILQPPPAAAQPPASVPMWGLANKTRPPPSMEYVKGTEIWECSLRQRASKAPGVGAPTANAMQQNHHQQPPQQQPQQCSWQPHSNIGGTWGEDEVENPNSMWTGVPAMPPSMPCPPGVNMDLPMSQWLPPGPPPQEKQWGGPGPSNQPPPHAWPGVPANDPMKNWNGMKKAVDHIGNGHGQAWPDKWDGNGGPDHSQMPPFGMPPDDRHRMGTTVWGMPEGQDKVSRWRDMPAPGAPKQPQQQQQPMWQPPDFSVKPKISPNMDWADGQIDTSNWNGTFKRGVKPLTRDLVRASREFYILLRLSFSPEEAESALRAFNMDLEAALAHVHNVKRSQFFQKMNKVPQGPPHQPPMPPPQQHHPQESQEQGQQQQDFQSPRVEMCEISAKKLITKMHSAVQGGYLSEQIFDMTPTTVTVRLLESLFKMIKNLEFVCMKRWPNVQQKNAHIRETNQAITAITNLIYNELKITPPDQAVPMPAPPPGNESRLNQWKLPSNNGSDMNGMNGNSEPNMDDMHGNFKWGGMDMRKGPQSDQTPVSQASTASSQASSAMNSSYNLSDIVAEFEPGKPWKGSWNMKSAEDDPHMTPGSVPRNPLMTAGMKDNEAGDWHRNPNAKILSTPWSESSNGNSNNQQQAMSKKWGELEPQQHQQQQRDQQQQQSAMPNLSANNSMGVEGFLVLKNLTAQIDGATLKTLCIQHGPIYFYHLFLNNGFALIKYRTREEALKAEAALNNCVLSNTTILAYVPSDREVQQLLYLAKMQPPPYQSRPAPSQQQRQLSSQEVGGWPPSNNGSNGVTGLGGAAGGGLWGPPDLGNNDNAPLNSFLPGDLLSGESM